MSEYKKSWIDYLPSDVLSRLSACRTIKHDLPVLVNARWAWMKDQKKYEGFTKEDALVCVLELLDCNNQLELADLSEDEYNDLKR